MSLRPHEPRATLETHRVSNQAVSRVDINLFDSDPLLVRLVAHGDASAHLARFAGFGARLGSEEVLYWGEQANRNPPQLRTHDRFGHRIDEVEFHPAWHALMDLSIGTGASAIAWQGFAAGHLAHSMLLYLLTQVDAGHGCPVSMTYAAMGALRAESELARIWQPRITAARYDPRSLPAASKHGCTLGMALTEKQGGSDVRSNTTVARAQADGSFELTGHKWFCSAPMSDAFLTLAKVDGDDAGLTCFLAPRWREDGSRNPIELQRLKDKLGDRSNASSEIEFRGAQAFAVGAPGRGVGTIIEMVQLTRLDCVTGAAATARNAVNHAIWHAHRRRAFGRRLIDQPLMRAVLADLVLETGAATALAMRVAMAFDRHDQPAEQALARLITPLSKYWVCKRCPGIVAEAMECLGGAGYVEEAPLARAFRQSPLNGIWEGSGNVIALDVGRVAARNPESLQAIADQLDAHLPAVHRTGARQEIEALRRHAAGSDPAGAQPVNLRRTCERLAVWLAGAVLAEAGETVLADAWLESRTGDGRSACYGAAQFSMQQIDALMATGPIDTEGR